MFELKGVDAFIAGIDKWLEEVEELAVEVYRGLAIEGLRAVVVETPQDTGNAASNWNFSIDSQDTSVTDELRQLVKSAEGSNLDYESFPQYSKRTPNPRAFELVAERNGGREFDLLSLDQEVYISNSSGLEESYIQLLEENPNEFLRKENDPGHMVQNAKTTLSTVYGNLTLSQITFLRDRLITAELFT